MASSSSTSDQQCGSGRESGWTMYFDDQMSGKITGHHLVNQEEDQEDESMVSDASSGPPPPNYYFQYDQYRNFDLSPTGNRHRGAAAAPLLCRENQKKNKLKSEAKKQQSFCLDDTASSQYFSEDINNAAPSHFAPLFSTTHRVEQESSRRKKGSSATKGKSGTNSLGRKRHSAKN